MMVEARGLLRSDRDFRWFWGAHSFSVIGTQVTAVALPLVAALTLGAGAAGVSLVTTATYLPNLLLPLLVGNWLEGRRKRQMMIWMDVIRAAMLAVVPITYLTGHLSLALLTVVAFGVGCGSVFFEVGAFAYLPSLVKEEQLGEANRAIQGSNTVAQVSGPGLAGLLVQLLGPALTVVVDVASYIVSAFGVGGARRAEPPAEPATKAGGSFAGIRILVGNSYLRALTMYASIYNAGIQIVLVNLVIWTIQERGMSPGMYGLVLSAYGVGAFGGAMVALQMARRLGFGRGFAVSAVLSTTVLLLIPLVPAHGVLLGVMLAGILVVAGVGLGAANVLSATLRQTVIPRNELSRTTGGYRLLMYGSIPLGSALGGVLGEVFGSHLGLAVGVVAVALSAPPMLTRTLRTLHEAKDARPPEPGRDEADLLAGTRLRQ